MPPETFNPKVIAEGQEAYVIYGCEIPDSRIKDAHPHCISALRAASLAIKGEWHDARCEGWPYESDDMPCAPARSCNCNSRLSQQIEEALG